MAKNPLKIVCNMHSKGSISITTLLSNIFFWNFRLSSGDHHHFVYIRGESEVEVHLPIAPQVEQGEIDVVIELNTQIMSSEQTVTIKILPEGSIVHRHTSALLDLKSRANVLRFMNIIVDETPIIPYEVKMNIPTFDLLTHGIVQ